MGKPLEIEVNGRRHAVEAPPDTPLLYVLRNEMDLRGPRFGCGLAQCGACTVHMDGVAIRSCVTPASAAAGARITTLEGLAAAYHGKEDEGLHPVQQAFIDEQAAQCGYCVNAWIMTSAALLDKTPDASDEQIKEGLRGLKCRCGTQISVMRAVRRASKAMA